jgi:TetR/AcrR family transcriptional regulator, tetracycline repressor protein
MDFWSTGVASTARRRCDIATIDKSINGREMAKIRRDEIVNAALELLDKIGLDALTTRKLAMRLGIESPTLYWHFGGKAELMSAMALAMVTEHHELAVPDDTERWSEWLADNTRSFRRSLLACRDGARLHAGSAPEGESEARLNAKIDYLSRAGFARGDAEMALLTTGQFALASALDQQAREANPAAKDARACDATLSFEFGLSIMVDGLASRRCTSA